MGIPNILLTRIDNRLVHGQVGVTWTTSLGANLLLVADDEIVKEPLQQQLMAVTAEASGAQIRFFTVEHTVNVIHKASANQKLFIICRTPGEVRRLVAGGVPIKEVNVGNMHFVQGKWPLSKKVYVDDTDMQDLKYILDQGVSVFIQDTPGDIKKYI
ncbi:N-acetylgalactosamine-specific phosphotransferase enzyme IIB component 1 [Propionispora sp. 2/2-37]|uniref:PTS galactosamine transporter subunit IIB n=1 Tax=Propionispora sp. 2/2-37 TaxID=1677858 RepID=UPI0006BB95AE|nr:PTS galactosamine transporter subunit IIB [Propionispora sp. 2/2-37]CUH95138.1 N-acetylgalactosamine-specific phosphotransferase enzyme IIB component 1 [Propionispora sp. 2/2-37]